MQLSGRLKLALLAGGVALFFLAVLVGVLPSILVNRPEVRSEIRERAAAALGSEVDFGRIRLTLIPRVCATVDAPRAAVPSGLRLQAEEAAVCLQVWPLLRGRVVPESVRLQTPVVRLPIAPVPEGSAMPDLPDPRQVLAGAKDELRRLPETRLEIAGGRVELAAADGSGFHVADLDLTLARRGDDIELAAEARSDVVSRFTAAAHFRIDDVAGSARFRVEGFRPERPYAFFFPGRPFRVLDTEGDLELDVAVDGAQGLTARATGRFPRLGAGWKAGASTVAIDRWTAEVELTEKRMAVRVPELVASSPRLALALGWVVDPDRRPRIELTLEGRGDAEGARAAALPFLADLEEGRLVCDIVRAGEIPHIEVKLAGDTADDLTRLVNLRIEGRLEHGRIALPFINFDARDVAGGLLIADGFLEARGIQARRNGLMGEDGSLRLGLLPTEQTLSLDIAVRADLAVLPDLLGRMIDDADFQGGLKRIQGLGGSAAGRLRLSGRIPDVAVEVDADEIDATGRFDAVPYPLGLRGGRLTYTREALTLRGVDLTVGRSKLTGQNAVVGLTGRGTLQAFSPEAVIDLGEAHAWLETVDPPPGLRGATGTLRLVDWRIDGPIGDPAAWDVSAGGALSDATVTTDWLAEPVRVPSGAIAWHGRRLRMSDMAPSWGRSSISGLSLSLDWSGTPHLGVQAARATLSLEDLLPHVLSANPPLQAQIDPLLPLSGTAVLQAIRSEVRFPPAGAELTSAGATIANATVTSAAIPQRVVLRSGTVTVGRAHVAVADVDVAFGRSEVRGLSLATEPGGGFELRAASAAIDCGEAFTAVAKLPAVQGLRRDISAVSGTLNVSELAVGTPTRARPRWTATADADVRELAVTTTFLDEPVRIEAARVRAFDTGPTAPAAGAVVQLDSARVQAGATRMQLTGAVTLTAEETALDLDIAADAIDWREITTISDRIAAARGARAEQPSALKGRVRLRADQFAYERFRVAPLQVTAELGPVSAVLIDRARICGMDFIGRLGVDRSNLNLYLVPVVDGADLERSIRCLTDEASVISGTFSLNGDLYGTGAPDTLLKALSGSFVVTAANGTIRRSLFFARLLALLNLTEIYRGQLPDLNTQGIDFQRTAARAEVKDGKIHIQEWSLQGRTFWMGARGEIDLTTRKIDFTVMVSPFRTIDRIVNSIPGVRWILGGRLIAIPMRASGHLEDPRLTPMSPSAVASSLLDMMTRTLMLPFHVIQPLVPGMEYQENTTISR